MATSPPSRLPARGARARPTSMYGSDVFNSTTENGATSKQSKRRSLLPQFTRKFSEDKESTESIAEAEFDIPSNSLPDTAEEEKKAMPPPPKPTGRGPGASAIARSTSVRTHARNASKSGVIPSDTGSSTIQAPTPRSHQRLDSGVKRSGSTRLPLSPSKRSIPPPAGSQTKSAHGRTSSTCTIATTSTDKRSSVLLSSGMGPSLVSPPSPTGPTVPRHSINKTQMLPPPRPTFSTYQQHYSPAKSSLPKPPIPSVRPGRKPGQEDDFESTLSLDTVKDQIELLQLSLLHQAAVRTTKEYESDALRKLGRTHARLKKDFDDIRASEEQRRRLENLAAVETWCPDAALLAEHLQTFSRIVSDLCSLSDSGSRYAELTATFLTWTARAENILLSESPESGFIGALPDTWRSTHTSLALKLRSLQRDLSLLPPPPALENLENASSLELMLDMCSLLVDGMLKELEVMTKLQKEMMQQEKARIDERASNVTQANEELQRSEKEKWIPAWQVTS